jgi:hypothetical protein
MMEWTKINGVGDLPKKPGKSRYEQIDCLIFHKGVVRMSMWNCEHGVWDDEAGDDFYCGPLEPSHYAIIELPSM